MVKHLLYYIILDTFLKRNMEAKQQNGMDTSLLKILDEQTDTPLDTDPRNESEVDNILGKSKKNKLKKIDENQPITGSLDINGSLKSITSSRVNGTGSSSSSNESNE